MKRKTNDHPSSIREDDPLGACFILKEIQELVYINKHGGKLFVTYVNKNLRREGSRIIRER